VLTWRWLAKNTARDERALADSANRMLRRLLSVMNLVSIREFIGRDPWPGLRDENDAPIWATAVAAQAQYVVRHNTQDFPPLLAGRHVYADIEYLTTIEFIEDVLGENAAEILGEALPDGVVRSQRTAQPK
jgi:predicted nucleic acid-binding protein